MIEEIDIIDPTPPFLLPEPYKGSLPEFQMFKHQAGTHDQLSHGNWAKGYSDEERAGIERMSKVGPTVEEMFEFVSGGMLVPLSMDEAIDIVLYNDSLYDAYIESIGGYISRDYGGLDEMEMQDAIGTAIEGNSYIVNFIVDNGIETRYAEEFIAGNVSSQAIQDGLNEVFSVEVTTPDGAKLSTDVFLVTVTNDDEIDVRGNINADTPDGESKRVGLFTRKLTPSANGELQVEHLFFKIDDENYRGAGLGKKFLQQSEDWYISRGVKNIDLETGMDGAYTWAKAGFDFGQGAESTAIPSLITQVRYAASVGQLSLNEVDKWNRLLERSTTGFKIKNTRDGLVYDYQGVREITDEEMPLPVEFARAPKAKQLMSGIGIPMTKYLTPEGRTLATGPIDRDGDGMVFDGTPRERPARPNELPVAAAKWSPRDTKLQAISDAFYRYGPDIDVESEGSDADTPELDAAIDKILGKMSKHYGGGHDQKTHGNWAIRVEPEVGESIRQFTREWGGLSINMVDGSMPTKGYMVAKPPEFGEVVDEADFMDEKEGNALLERYMRRHRKDLGTGRNYLGTWLNEGKVYLDVSENIQDKDEATRIGRDRNQKAIWDVENLAEIDTGGTGAAEKASRHSGIEEHRRHDRRRDKRVREGHLEKDGGRDKGAGSQKGLDRFRSFSFSVIKHQSGQHDQQSHGNWASGTSVDWNELGRKSLNYDLDARLSTSQKEARANITGAESNGLWNYAQVGHTVNRYARGYDVGDLDKMMKESVDALDSLIEKMPPLKEDVVAYRGVNSSGIPDFKGLDANDTLVDDGFMSVSLDSKVASGFSRGYLMEVLIPKGTKGYVNTGRGINEPDFGATEREIILPRGTKLKFVSDEGSVDMPVPESVWTPNVEEQTFKVRKIRVVAESKK